MTRKTLDADRVQTLHPAGKNGVRIERTKYDAMRRAILRCAPRSVGGIALTELNRRVAEQLDRTAFGPHAGITWYLITVKQDLQARGLLELVPGRGAQHLRRGRGNAALRAVC